MFRLPTPSQARCVSSALVLLLFCAAVLPSVCNPVTPSIAHASELIPGFNQKANQTTGKGIPGVTVRFSPGNPLSFQQGDPGVNLRLRVTGQPLPADADLVVIAWSGAQSQLIDPFAHGVSGPGFLLDPAKTALLPAGEIELQVLVRRNGKVAQIVRHPYLITPGLAAGPAEPDPELIANQDKLDDILDNLPTWDQISGAGIPGISIVFPEDTPLIYEIGSDQAVRLQASAPLPKSVDLLAIAWSIEERRIVAEFSHGIDNAGLNLDPARMDLLPTGINLIQVLVRQDRAVVQRVQRPFLVLTDHIPPMPGGGDAQPEPQPNPPAPPAAPVDPPAPAPAPAPTPDPVAPAPPVGPQPPAGGLDRPGEGWSDFEPSKDSRVIYVSSSTGNDKNDGLSPRTAVKSPRVGLGKLRRHYPDWLLFKRGDTFTQPIGSFYLSGRSAKEPMIIGSYGDGARPRFAIERHGIETVAKSVNDRPLRHVIFRDLHLHAVTRDPTSKQFDAADITNNLYGVRWVHPAENITFENMLVEYFQLGFGLIPRNLANRLETAATDMTIRRCVVLNNYGSWANGHRGKSQGVYANRVDGLTIEQSIFDHNGWEPRVRAAGRNKFNHNLYIAENNANVVIRGNILTRAASHAFQLRCGGVVENNLIAYCAVAGFVTGSDSRMVGNVVLHGDDFNTDQAGERRGFGLSAFDVRQAIVENNIIASRESSRQSAGLLIRDSVKSGRVRNNVVWWWHDKHGRGIDVGPRSGVSVGGNVTDNYAPFADPQRTLTDYVEDMGYRRLGDWFKDLRRQQRGDWAVERTAAGAIEWIAEGFEFAD